MTFSFRFVLILTSILQAWPAHAAVVNNWTNPSSQLPSFSSTYLVGERIFLSWLSLNTSRDDLWLTRYDKSVDNFTLRIASDLDLGVSGSYAWTVAVTDAVVLVDTRFVFDFIPAGYVYDAQAQMQLQSPAFNIMLVNQNTAPNGTVGSPTTTASSTSASATTSTETTSSSVPFGSHQQRHPSTGATVGIAVAVLASVGFIGFAVGYLVFKRKQNRHHQKISLGNSNSDITLAGPYEVLGGRKQPAELRGGETHVHELTVSKEITVNESNNTIIHEASTTVKRPGLHEMPG